MARSQSPSEAALQDVLARAVTPALKAAGFRKSGLSYHRRRGEAVQVVNVQVSHGSSAMSKTFFLNVGIAFDAVCWLKGLPILERPKEYDCDDRGTRDRLEALFPGLPAAWKVAEVTGPVVDSLGPAVDRLVTELDRIDGAEAYRNHPWFDRFRPAPLNAQIFYLLGDLDDAWREVEALATFFADRQNANRPQWWVERLRLTDLGPRLG